jgi:predicted enzyme related to lactoylglutathione lyase
MITDIAFFVYPVVDITRSREFYEKTLGLPVGEMATEQWVEYNIGGGTFAITTMDTSHRAGAAGGVIAFEVADLENFVDRLGKRGVRFVSPIGASPVCRFAVISDPDGNEIIIHKRNPA